jgi:hypothetical protein
MRLEGWMHCTDPRPSFETPHDGNFANEPEKKFAGSPPSTLLLAAFSFAIPVSSPMEGVV